MNIQELNDLVFKYVKEYNKANDFQSACKTMQDKIYNINIRCFIPLISEIGVIPENINHDSKEEKLYTKVSEIFLARCFSEIGFKVQLFTTRGDTADVLAKSAYHNYTLVADAKAFRLSRTAKNQKDFKVESMDGWRHDNDYAVLCCPYFQYPKRKSAIYKQSIDKNVSLLSWEHFSFLIKNNIKETVNLNLSELWNYGAQKAKITTVATADTCFLEEQNKFIESYLHLGQNSLENEFKLLKKVTINRCTTEIAFWERKIDEIKKYDKQQAIDYLIESLKLREKISTIRKYREDLSK